MSASCHKWAIVAVDIRHGERVPGDRIISRHKTRYTAECMLPRGSGWGGSGTAYHVRRLTKKERGIT